MRAKIRYGALTGQDHHVGKWQADDTIFQVTKIGPRLYKCVAPGYGQLWPTHEYGNGAVYIRRLGDLIPINGGE